jgi:electron transport complex protein RnfG
MTAAATAQGGTLAAVYQAQSGGQPVGYAINVEASGSQGTISMMVGIDMDGAVTGVSIVTNSETSGIGSKVMSNEPLTNGTRVLDQFIADGVLSVGSNVDAITGATVSTKGVTTGVNAALAAAGVIG